MYSAVHPHQNLASQYKNLWIRYSYLKSRSHIDWVFGAVTAFRKDRFLKVGGFDDTMHMRYGGEDLELGKRYADQKHLIRLDQSVEVVHLKRHTLKTLLLNDLRRSRGFVNLAGNLGQLGKSLRTGFVNIYSGFVYSTLLAWLLLVHLLLAPWFTAFQWAFLVSLVAYLSLNLPFIIYSSKHRGSLEGLKIIGIMYLDHLVCALGSLKGFLLWLFSRSVPQKPPTR